jgi:hypothetical protein
MLPIVSSRISFVGIETLVQRRGESYKTSRVDPRKFAVGYSGTWSLYGKRKEKCKEGCREMINGELLPNRRKILARRRTKSESFINHREFFLWLGEPERRLNSERNLKKFDLRSHFYSTWGDFLPHDYSQRF